MSPAVLTESPPVAKKKPARPEATPAEQPFGRIELQAPPDWIEQLDAVAKAMGTNRSAYIRGACNRQMAEDRKVIEGNRQ
jgi:hypothetical protein